LHMVTHPSTNRARRRLTTMVEIHTLPQSHTTNRHQCCRQL